MTHIKRIDEMANSSNYVKQMFEGVLDILFENKKYPCLNKEEVSEIMSDSGLVLAESNEGNYPYDYYKLEGNEQYEGIYVFFDKKSGFIKSVQPPFSDSRFNY